MGKRSWQTRDLDDEDREANDERVKRFHNEVSTTKNGRIIHENSVDEYETPEEALQRMREERSERGLRQRPIGFNKDEESTSFALTSGRSRSKRSKRSKSKTSVSKSKTGRSKSKKAKGGKKSRSASTRSRSKKAGGRSK